MNNNQSNRISEELSILLKEMQENKDANQMINFTKKLLMIKSSPEYLEALFNLLCSSEYNGLCLVISLLKDALLDIKRNYPESKQSNN